MIRSRVFLVCGSPTWNYRFLRQGFSKIRSIDMISLFILRTPTDVVNVPESQLSLTFPTQRLFTRTKNFDLIIFENFSYQLYFPGIIWRMCKYVQEGGTFAMIGGSLASPRGTPARLSRRFACYLTPGPQRLSYSDPAYGADGRKGKAHPITRLTRRHRKPAHLGCMLELDALNLVATGQARRYSAGPQWWPCR